MLGPLSTFMAILNIIQMPSRISTVSHWLRDYTALVSLCFIFSQESLPHRNTSGRRLCEHYNHRLHTHRANERDSSEVSQALHRQHSVAARCQTASTVSSGGGNVVCSTLCYFTVHLDAQKQYQPMSIWTPSSRIPPPIPKSRSFNPILPTYD